MDEPCSALDPIATRKIEELMHELRERFTIAIVTHNLQQAQRVADYTGFLYVDTTAGRTDRLSRRVRRLAPGLRGPAHAYAAAYPRRVQLDADGGRMRRRGCSRRPACCSVLGRRGALARTQSGSKALAVPAGGVLISQAPGATFPSAA